MNNVHFYIKNRLREWLSKVVPLPTSEADPWYAPEWSLAPQDANGASFLLHRAEIIVGAAPTGTIECSIECSTGCSIDPSTDFDAPSANVRIEMQTPTQRPATPRFLSRHHQASFDASSIMMKGIVGHR